MVGTSAISLRQLPECDVCSFSSMLSIEWDWPVSLRPLPAFFVVDDSPPLHQWRPVFIRTSIFTDNCRFSAASAHFCATHHWHSLFLTTAATTIVPHCHNNNSRGSTRSCIRVSSFRWFSFSFIVYCTNICLDYICICYDDTSSHTDQHQHQQRGYHAVLWSFCELTDVYLIFSLNSLQHQWLLLPANYLRMTVKGQTTGQQRARGLNGTPWWGKLV